MPYAALEFAPGIVKDETAYGAKGAWVDGQWVRFVRGRPQKIGGYELAASDDTFAGKARGHYPWSDNNGDKYCAIGTHTKVYALAGGGLYDITPIRTTGTYANNPIATTSGDETVTITHTAHGATAGDTVYITGATAVGGITIGGATGSFAASPFQTFTGSKGVLCTLTAHGMSTGWIIDVAGGAAVGGITISGTYTVRVTSVDTFILYHTTAATSAATGGGTPTYEIFKPYVLTLVDANSYTIEHSSPASSTTTGGGAAVDYKYEINVGYENGGGGSGYGTGTYGTGPYGVSTPGEYYARTWAFANWGQNLIANPRGGTIYEWTLGLSQRAAAISNAPAKCNYVIVTPERYLVALGCTDVSSSYDPMAVRWTTQEDNTVWTPAATNTAGDFRLATGARIVAANVSKGQNLVWTDQGLYAMRFDIQFVYTFEAVSTGCGLIGPNAAIEKDGIAYWMGNTRQFFGYAGGTAQPIASPVREFVFDAIAAQQEDKIYAGINVAFGEVWWLYPTLPANECDRYITLNSTDGTWSPGAVDRTVYGDGGVFGYPIGCDTSGRVYYHERGYSANGSALSSSIKSAPLDIRDGAVLVEVNGMLPDFTLEDGAALTLTVGFRDYPFETESTDGPYSVTSASGLIDMRAMGRQASVLIENNDVGYWRLGTLRADVMTAGARR